MAHKVKAVKFVSRPVGKPTSDIFKVEDIQLPQVGDNEVRLKVLYLSVDPYMRGRMKQAWELDKVQAGWALVQVVESKSVAAKVGSVYVTLASWQEEIVGKVPDVFIPVPHATPEIFSIAGIAGLTAIIGTDTVGKVKAGETFVVSAAAGSVGILAGQIAKIHGAHVIGICGSDEKCALIKTYGFDGAVNYKKTKDIKADIKSLCPKGTVDVYFDNVGGAIADAILDLIAPGARIIVCGQISVYNEDDPNAPALQGPRHWQKLIYTQARIEGFTIGPHQAAWPAYITTLLGWADQGKLRTPVSIEHGLNSFGKAFLNLFEGENKGKQLVKVSTD